MRILIICPAKAGSRMGNRVTATRWRGFLRALGHKVTIAAEVGRRRCDLLVALHARRSAGAVIAMRARHPEVPIIVALTGTDLYRDVRTDGGAKRALRLADRLIVLHEKGAFALPKALRPKVRVIHQSCPWVMQRGHAAADSFQVAVVGHLREEKDPFRTALAARLLPASSRVQVVHAGRALSAAMRVRARAEMRVNPRYRWVGETSASATRKLIAGSALMVLSSRMEGGANVLSEAIVARTPIVCSRIHSSVGILGAKYPGFFRVGSTSALARLLRRCETDSGFRATLLRAARVRRSRFHPRRERSAWRELLREMFRGIGAIRRT